MRHRDSKSQSCTHHPRTDQWAVARSLASQLVVVLFTSLVCQSSAHAQQSDSAPKTMVDVFKVMLSADGIMTPQLHKTLWDDLVRQIGNDPTEIKRFWSIIEKNPDFSSARFSFEAGHSAIRSLRGNKSITTPRYDAAGKILVDAMKDEKQKAKIRGSIAKWNDSFTKLGGVRYNPNNPKLVSAAEGFDNIVVAAHRQLHHLSVMRKRQFEPVIVENEYASLPFSIEWPGVFQFEATSKEVGGGRTVKVVSLGSRMSDNSVAKVILYRLRVKKEESLARAGAIAKGWMQTFGVKGGKIGRQKWRGMPSIRAKGKCQYEGAACDLELRSLTLPGGNAVVVFSAFSLTGVARANELFGRLERSIKLTDTEPLGRRPTLLHRSFPVTEAMLFRKAQNSKTRHLLQPCEPFHMAAPGTDDGRAGRFDAARSLAMRLEAPQVDNQITTSVAKTMTAPSDRFQRVLDEIRSVAWFRCWSSSD